MIDQTSCGQRGGSRWSRADRRDHQTGRRFADSRGGGAPWRLVSSREQM